VLPRSLGDLFFKATFLAEQLRASEICIDILLAALDAPEVDPSSFIPLPPELAGSESYGFFSNTDWKPLSAAAAKALAPFAEMEMVDPNDLRKALLEAKRE
jgi:hypothetical protein